MSVSSDLASVKIDEPVSVSLAFDAKNSSAFPYLMRWSNKLIKLRKLGYHHKVREGATLMHYFHVADESTTYKLRLNTDDLSWRLISVSTMDQTADVKA